MSNKQHGRVSDLRPRWHERWRSALSPGASRWSSRKSGRRWRVLRRLLSVTLLVAAAVVATWEQAVPLTDRVLALTSDLPTGTVLSSADVELTLATDPPGGVLRTEAEAVGRVLVSPVRQGEILTDVRLVSPDGPSAGPGRKAVAVRPSDPAMAAILTPGVHVAVVGIDSAGLPIVLTADAIVLTLPATVEEQEGFGSATTSPVLLSVVVSDVDRVTAATLSGDIALRYS